MALLPGRPVVPRRPAEHVARICIGMAWTTRPEAGASESAVALRVRLFELIQGLQSGEEGAAEEIAGITALAERSGFDAVVRIGLFGRAVKAWMAMLKARMETLKVRMKMLKAWMKALKA